MNIGFSSIYIETLYYYIETLYYFGFLQQIFLFNFDFLYKNILFNLISTFFTNIKIKSMNHHIYVEDYKFGVKYIFVKGFNHRGVFWLNSSQKNIFGYFHFPAKCFFFFSIGILNHLDTF